MFYDTYGTVLGHLTAKTCKKYSKFDKLGCNLCNKLGNIQRSKLMESDTNGTAYIKYTSEYQIEFNKNIKSSTLCSCNTSCLSNNTGQEAGYSPFQNPWWNYGWIRSSYDHNIEIRFSGFNFKKQLQILGHYNYNIFTTSNKAYNSSLPHELDNAVYRSYLDMHNTVYTDTNRSIGIGGKEGNWAEDAKTRSNSSFSAKMASELDAKVDDGRPGSGKILALKGGHAHNADTTEDQHKAVCYDKMADEVDKAIYENSTDIKYGCNIIKVMEDVK